MALNLQTLLEETVPGMGYELVDVEFGSRGLLRVFIDKPEGLTIDDCVAVSNHLTRLFMVENIAYERLEVSSPGMDRPLKKVADFERFAGEAVKVKLRVPQEDGRRHFSGKLLGLIDGNVTIEQQNETLRFPRQTVDRVRLDPQFPEPGANKKK
ncbi:ribosome maturation factor RimP [Formivibrio citricus]|uniref:Ribosome maturation factor RimP n=1 Tax=Formivibrio citricus TaxID=83765 RepID=A0A1I4W8S2_9NEIS|nr:ribosome maturation factor RimP [Formivibrio citricus]